MSKGSTAARCSCSICPDGLAIDVPQAQIDAGTMRGFVKAYQAAYPEARELDPGDVMRQLDRAHQPMTYFLADEFTICNRWFSAVPTDTIPNRLYSLAGDAGHVRSTEPDIDLAGIPQLDSIFEQLDPEHWMLFSGSIPLAFAVSPIRTIVLDHDRWHTLSKFAEMVPRLPKLTWIDPTYYWLDSAGGLPRRVAHVDSRFPIANDDHPPSQTERGQEPSTRASTRSDSPRREPTRRGPTWRRFSCENAQCARAIEAPRRSCEITAANPSHADGTSFAPRQGGGRPQ